MELCDDASVLLLEEKVHQRQQRGELQQQIITKILREMARDNIVT